MFLGDCVGVFIIYIKIILNTRLLRNVENCKENTVLKVIAL